MVTKVEKKVCRPASMSIKMAPKKNEAPRPHVFNISSVDNQTISNTLPLAFLTTPKYIIQIPKVFMFHTV